MRVQNLPTSLTNAWDRLSASSNLTTSSTGAGATATSSDVGDELILSEGESPATPDVYRHELLSTSPGGDIKVEDIAKQLEQKIGGLQARLVRLFAQHGIDDAAGVKLRTSADGSVRVVGDHPQKDEIEKLFTDDPKLRNDFVEVQAQSEFMQAAKEAIEFQEAYRKNPQKALEEFKHLFQERTDSFTFVLQGGQAKVTFER